MIHVKTEGVQCINKGVREGFIYSRACEVCHAQRISMAAAIGEAAGIHKGVRIMKQVRCASERAARAGAA